ncbi:MAG: hydrogenase maturation protease [Spirochaetota bacterium]|nr:hydrogenase maturation protease [Spirochaetota bacterium]
MFQYDPEQNLLIVGFGNPLLSDDGLGVEVVKALGESNLPENIHLWDGGTMNVDSVDLLSRYSQAIIIDCLELSQSHSGIVEFSLNDVVLKKDSQQISAHHINLADALNLMLTLDMRIPDILFLGVTGESVRLGEGLSPVVEESVGAITNRILSLIMGTKYKVGGII